MTGYGAYLYIIWGIWLRHVLNKEQDDYILVWPHMWTFPEIIRVPLGQQTDAPSKKLI
jgi:dihydroceramidase